MIANVDELVDVDGLGLVQLGGEEETNAP